MGAKMRQLYEQYRPASWADVVGQDRAVKKIHALARRGLAGRAYWITGKSGTGKTTIARLLAQDVADPLFIEEIDAGTATPARLQHMETALNYTAFGKGGRVIIINEAHGLSKAAVRQLLVMLERLPGHCMMIFTTTNDGQQALFEGMDDASPLLSRCIEIQLARRDLSRAFAEKVREIAVKEGLDGQPIERYIKLANDCKGNMRAMLQAVEVGDLLD